MQIEKNLARLSPEERFEEEARLSDMGYNVGEKRDDREKIKKVFQ